MSHETKLGQLIQFQLAKLQLFSKIKMSLKLNHNNSGLMKKNQLKLEMPYPKFVTEQVLLKGRR